MTTTETSPKTDPPASDSDDKPILHFFCAACHPALKPGAVALCGHRAGADSPAFERVPKDWPLCVVCQDLVMLGCPKCGAGR